VPPSLFNRTTGETSHAPPPDAVARACRTHPLLDPLLSSRQRTALRFWLPIYRRLRTSPGAADELLSRFTTTTIGPPQLPAHPIAQYFDDADQYIDGVLGLAPLPIADALRPLSDTRQLRNVAGLLQCMFGGATARHRYEAQRKLCLMMLLFDIDHARSVRDAARHLAAFEQLLDRTLWREVASTSGAERVGRIAPRRGHGPIDLIQYQSRLKREGAAATVSGAPTPQPRRSGSILSKMIRRGIGDAHQVADVLGAMFIVGDRRQAYALERRLVEALGGPFRWRDRVDTLATPTDASRRNHTSSPAFRVLKQTVDLLVADAAAASPYLVPIEIQIQPIEMYRETRSVSGLASHQQYKWRQFARELAPILFPASVFGAIDLPAHDGA